MFAAKSRMGPFHRLTPFSAAPSAHSCRGHSSRIPDRWRSHRHHQDSTIAGPPVPLDFRIVAVSDEMIVMLLWFSNDPLVGRNGAVGRRLLRGRREQSTMEKGPPGGGPWSLGARSLLSPPARAPWCAWPATLSPALRAATRGPPPPLPPSAPGSRCPASPRWRAASPPPRPSRPE